MRRERGTTGQRFVRAEEAADLLRVAVNTVYRWCRAGRLRARKFGREWRIDSSALEELGHQVLAKPTDLLEPLFRHIHQRSEHLFGLAVDETTEQRLQALFLETALREPGSVVCLALWDESPEEATDRLRATLAPQEETTSKLRFLQLGKRYTASGLAGVLDELRDAVARAEARGGHLCVTGSPQRFFGANVERLLELEGAVGDLLEGKPVTVLCTYEHTANRDYLLRMAFELTECHSGAVWFDGWHPPHLLRKIV